MLVIRCYTGFTSSGTETAEAGAQIGIVLDKTSFYGEQGGQMYS